MTDRITPEKAEILALEALGWLAGRPEGIDRFLAVSGLDAGRPAAGGRADRDLLGSVLDFLLANEDASAGFLRGQLQSTPKAVHLAGTGWRA